MGTDEARMVHVVPDHVSYLPSLRDAAMGCHNLSVRHRISLMLGPIDPVMSENRSPRFHAASRQ
jgi:hypothetical protein